MNPLDRPRRTVRVLAVLIALAAAWLLLVPITAVYVTSDANPAPRDLSSLYSWWTNEQSVIYDDVTGVDLNRANPQRLTEGIRMDCGTALSAGPHERARPAGPTVCAELDRPRRVTGLALLVVAILGVALARLVPAESARHRNRYHLSWRHRRRLMRGR